MIYHLILKFKYRFISISSIIRYCFIVIAIGVLVFSDSIVNYINNVNNIKVKSDVILKNCPGIIQVQENEDVYVYYQDGYHFVTNENIDNKTINNIKACLLDAETNTQTEDNNKTYGLEGVIAMLFLGILSYTSTTCQEVILDNNTNVSKLLKSKASAIKLTITNLLFGWLCMVVDLIISVVIAIAWILVRLLIKKDLLDIIVQETYSSNNSSLILIIVIIGAIIFQVLNVAICTRARKSSEVASLLIVPQSLLMALYFIASNAEIEWMIRVGNYLPMMNAITIPFSLNKVGFNANQFSLPIFLFIIYEAIIIIISVILIYKQKQE